MRLLLFRFLLMTCLALATLGCETLKELNITGAKDDDAEYADWDAEKFHTNAKQAMDNEDFQKAIELYEKLEARYPFGEYAAQSQLDVAYAYYKNGEPEAAIAAAERFIKIHPRNPSIDYAYYLKGLVNYNRGIGFLERYLPTDSSQRDPGNAQDAYENFEELVRRFPESTYTDDAKQRMLALRNNLAMYEIHVARFYMDREAYIAAVNRAANVLEKYQRTQAVPYALQIMQDAYLQLELDDLANDASRVYAQNFPNGPPPPMERDDKSGVVFAIWDFIGFDR